MVLQVEMWGEGGGFGVWLARPALSLGASLSVLTCVGHRSNSALLPQQVQRALELLATPDSAVSGDLLERACCGLEWEMESGM